jgi:hypothetical protein
MARGILRSLDEEHGSCERAAPPSDFPVQDDVRARHGP